MRDYLNSQEKTFVCKIGALSGELSDIIMKWPGLTKEAKKFLRTAQTYSHKALAEIYSQVTLEDQEKVRRLIRSLSVVMTANPKALFAIIDEIDAVNIAEAINEKYCKVCDGKIKKCRWRNLLSCWDIDCIAVNKDCGYSYTEGKEGK